MQIEIENNFSVIENLIEFYVLCVRLDEIGTFLCELWLN